MSDDKKNEDKGVILFGEARPDGGRDALRIDQNGIRSGVVRTMEEGPIDDGDTVITCESIADSVGRIVNETPAKGPSKANSRAYRTGWDNIFGNKQTVGQA